MRNQTPTLTPLTIVHGVPTYGFPVVNSKDVTVKRVPVN